MGNLIPSASCPEHEYRSTHDLDEPRRFWDFFVTITIGIACIPFILGNIILLCNRKYRPIKTKSVSLTVMSSLGGLIWVAATIVVNNHLGRYGGTFWTICSLWTFWLQACFGFSLWLNCMNVRLLVLYTIFVRKKSAKRFKYYLITLMGLLLPTIALCICASVKHGSRFVCSNHKIIHPLQDHPPGDCKIKNKIWSFGLLSLSVVYFLIFLGLAFKLRKAMAQFNEFRLIRNGGVMSLFLLLLSLVTIQTQAYSLVVGRSFLSLSVASAVFYYFWARNAEVIYNVIVHKEEYARKFNEEMNRYPSERERDDFPSSFQNLETELREARVLLRQCQSQRKQLEREIDSMNQTLSHRQQQVELSSMQVIEDTEMSKTMDLRALV